MAPPYPKLAKWFYENTNTRPDTEWEDAIISLLDEFLELQGKVKKLEHKIRTLNR